MIQATDPEQWAVRGTAFFETPTNPLPPIRWVDSTPTQVDVGQALTVTAIYACVRFLSETLASMPMHLYRRLPGGDREIVTDHPMHHVLCVSPNHWQSQYEYTEQQIYHTALWGNSYSLIVPGEVRGKKTWCAELWPMHPSRMRVDRAEDNSIRYRYWHPDGTERSYTAEQIFHLRGLSDDGLVGMMPAELCKTSVNLARTLDIAAMSYWENNARPNVLLEPAAPLNDGAITKLRQTWKSVFGGPKNTGQAAVLPHGVTAKIIDAASREGSQFMDLRNAVVTEVARAFRVGPTLIGQLDHGTYSNVEMEQIGAQVFTLAPWQKRREQSIYRQLLSFYEQDDLYVIMDSRGLMRGDSAARSNYFSSLFQLGALSPNDIRRLEDLDQINDPAADEYYVQLNMAPLSKAATIGPDGKPAAETPAAQESPDAPAPAGPAGPAVETLNGAQISSLLEVLANVSGGLITPDGARAIIAAAFPMLTAEQIASIVGGVIPGVAIAPTSAMPQQSNAPTPPAPEPAAETAAPAKRSQRRPKR
jgi:HK97 family phage portal protein